MLAPRRIALCAALLGPSVWACSASKDTLLEATAARDAAQRAAATSAARAAAGRYPTPARVVPRSVWDSAEPRVIVSGLRTERSQEGELLTARELIPGNEEPSSLELPERLGGGYLFYTASSSTQIFRAKTWTAPLEPLATIEMRAERIEPGFDRLYALGRRETWALDPHSGISVALGSLPKAAAYRELSFGDGFSALVEVPLAGVLATFDAGQNWWPVRGANGIVAGTNELLVTTAPDERVLRLDEAGALEPYEPASGADEVELPSRVSAERAALEAAILRGAFAGKEGGRARAWVILGSDLLLVDLGSGRAVERISQVVDPEARCHAVEWGTELAFVCSRGEGGARGEERTTELLRFAPGRLEPLAHFEGARVVLGAGPAGILVEGACAASATNVAVAPSSQKVCVVSSAGKRDVALPARGIAVSAKAGLFVLVPPRDKPGTLSLPSGKGLTLTLPPEDEVRALLSNGQWLKNAWQGDDGRLAFWVAGGDSFVGVRVDERGRVEAGTIQRPLRRSLISGPFVLVWGAAGFAKESVDGGLTFHDASFPYRTGDPDPSQPREESEVELGCSALGCILGPWLRIGWGAEQDGRLVEAKAPAFRAPYGLQGGRWRLVCRPSGRASEPSRADDNAHEPWVGLDETPPPERGARSISYTLSTLADDARIYAWGPDDGSWGERGNIAVTFHHPSSFEAPLRTLVGRTPWADGQRAALAFADGGSSGIAIASAAFDPNGRGGLLLLRSPAEAHLFVVEAQRAPLAVQGVNEVGFAALDDVVQSGDAWYTTQPFGASIRLYRVRGGRIDVVADLPAGRGGAPLTRVVRSARGNNLAIWADGEAGSVLYPWNEATGALEAPIVVPTLVSRPHACSPDANGYLLSMELSVAPQVDLLGMPASVDVSRVTAEVLVGASEPCLVRLSATTRDAVTKAVAQPAPDSDAVPLTLTEKLSAGRRYELVCGGK